MPYEPAHQFQLYDRRGYKLAHYVVTDFDLEKDSDAADRRLAEVMKCTLGLARDRWSLGEPTTDINAPGCAVHVIYDAGGDEIAVLRDQVIDVRSFRQMAA